MPIEDYLRRGFCFAPDAGAEAAVVDDPEEVVETQEPAAEPTTDVEPAHEPAPAAPEPVDTNAELLKTLSAFGLPADPQGVAARLRDYNAAQQQNAQLRAMLWQIEQNKAQATPAAAPQVADKPKLPWELPKFDPRLKQQLIYDDQGNLTVRPGGPPNLVAEYQQYVQAREDALDKLLADPYGVMQQGLMPLIQAEAQKIVQQQFQQTQSQFAQQTFQQKVAGYYEKNKEWMEDPITRAPTAWGTFWGNQVQIAQRMGHPDPVEYAEQAIDAQLFRAQQMEAAQHPAAPAAPVKDSRVAFLQARNKPGRGGSLPRPNGKKSPAQNNDPWEKLRADLATGMQHDPNFLDDN